MNIKITDDFMPNEVFEEYENIFKEIFWFTGKVLYEGATCDPSDNFMFSHIFYKKFKPQSELYFKYIDPLLDKMQIQSLIAVKANLTTKTEKIIKHGFHIDYEAVVDGEVQETHNCFTSILYLNTNDGYTEFENGTKIESNENRLITFPLSYRHTGTTCTNYPFRSVINFNYF